MNREGGRTWRGSRELPGGARVIGIGVLGLGSVFSGPYMSLLQASRRRVIGHVAASTIRDPDKCRAAGDRLDLDASLTDRTT